MEPVDVSLVNHNVTLGATSVRCAVEADDIEAEFWWSPSDGMIPLQFDGAKLSRFDQDQIKFMRAWSAAAHQMVFAGSGHI